MADLSVVIVNYNVRHFLEQCLESVFKASLSIDVEVFVIDNASIDGSREYIGQRFPTVNYIYNQKNVGFSKANNQGIRLSSGRHVLLLNPDTLVEVDTFSKCLQYMEANQRVGALGVKMVDGKGVFLPESKRGLPTPWVAFYKIFGLSKLFPSNKKFGRYHLSYLPPDETNEVDILSGAFMWLRAEAINKTGLLDEDYFMYGEDIDLSYRIQKAGYKNVYFPQTRIIHYKGESTKRTSVNYVFVFYRAMLIFAQKHFAKRNSTILNVLIEGAIYARASYAIFSRMASFLILPLLDYATIFTSIVALKEAYAVLVKHDPVFYPDNFTSVVIPVYTLVWVITAYVHGLYSRPYKVTRILSAVAIGAIVISAGTNFFDDYRFSKAIILLGMLAGALWLYLNRLLINFVVTKKLSFAGENKVRTLIIGDIEEAERAHTLIVKSQTKADYIGWVSPPEGSMTIDESFVGRYENLNQIVNLFKIEEIIFCSKSLASNIIIEAMTLLAGSGLQFKISAQNAEYIIGSNGPQTLGELYSLGLNSGLAGKRGSRQKQTLDYSLAFILLILSPILIWVIGNKRGFVNNILEVLMGQRTWVGLSERETKAGRSIKPGVLNTISGQKTAGAANTADLHYTTHYSPLKDLYIIFKSYSQLGNRLAQ